MDLGTPRETCTGKVEGTGEKERRVRGCRGPEALLIVSSQWAGLGQLFTSWLETILEKIPSSCLWLASQCSVKAKEFVSSEFGSQPGQGGKQIMKPGLSLCPQPLLSMRCLEPGVRDQCPPIRTDMAQSVYNQVFHRNAQWSSPLNGCPESL